MTGATEPNPVSIDVTGRESLLGSSIVTQTMWLSINGSPRWRRAGLRPALQE